MHIRAGQSDGDGADQSCSIGCRDGDAKPAGGHIVGARHGLCHLGCPRDVAWLKIHHDHIGPDGALQLGRRALLHDAAIGQDRHAIGERIGFFQVLRGQKHGDAQLAVEATHLVPDLGSAHRVKPGGGLVQEDHFRSVDQRRSQVEPPLHPAAVGGDAGIDGIADIGQVDGPLDRGSPVRGAKAVQPGLQVEDLAAGLLLVERCLLHGHADADAHLTGILRDVVTGDPGLAGGRAQQRAQHPHRGALTSAIRPEEPEDLAFADQQIHTVDRTLGAEVAHESMGLDGRHRPA